MTVDVVREAPPVDRFVEALAERSGRASGVRTTIERDVAALRIRFEIVGSRLTRSLGRSLSHPSPTAPQSHGEIRAIAFETADWSLPAVAAGAEGDRNGTRALFDPLAGTLSAWEPASQRLFFCIGPGTMLPLHEQGAPFFKAMHWALASRGVQLAHAAAIAFGGRAVLIAGGSGAGKSTTAIAALLGGAELLGDDRVAVSLDPQPVAHALYSTVKLLPDGLERWPQLGRHRVAVEDAATGKSILDLVPEFGDRLPGSRPIVALVVPQRAARTGDPERMPSREAAVALLPSSLMQLPDADGGSVLRLANLARTVPAYRLPVGPDLSGVVERLASLAR